MHPKDPDRIHLYDDSEDEDLILACASSGCSSCLYYFDVEDARAPARLRDVGRPRWRKPLRCPTTI